MATELCLISVSDAELQQFHNDPSLLSALREKCDAEPFGANHRNVEIFHFLLNGTRASVPGPLGLFLTWLGDVEVDASYRIDDESFGMVSSDVTALVSALEDLTDERIRERWRQWQEQKGIDPEKDGDLDFFPVSFGLFRKYCTQAMHSGKAIVWVAG